MIIIGSFAKRFLNKLLDNADYSTRSYHMIIDKLIQYDNSHLQGCTDLIEQLNGINIYNGLALLLTNVDCDIELFRSIYGFKYHQLSTHSRNYLKGLDKKMYTAQGKQLNGQE